jgi:hypothetical protein
MVAKKSLSLLAQIVRHERTFLNGTFAISLTISAHIEGPVIPYVAVHKGKEE